MLWTMAQPLLAEQLATPQAPDQRAVYRRAGLDEWLAVDPAPESPPAESDTAATFTRAGVAAAALARSADLVASDHLRARGFWDEAELPGLPWRASFGRAVGPAPGLGADTDAVLRDVAGMSADDTLRLRQAGALG
jgi:crotonobetainyl-CoA:carnitine CoA-transferase CaiB-like acyl-CoA transferase